MQDFLEIERIREENALKYDNDPEFRAWVDEGRAKWGLPAYKENPFREKAIRKG